jgi:hypothetical protein
MRRPVVVADLIWPVDVVPYRVAFYLQAHVGGTESPITRVRKTYQLSAPRWVCRLTFRGGYDGDRAEAAMGAHLDAFIADLEGGAKTVPIYDFRRPVRRRQSAQVATLTNAAAAAGSTTMTISGFAPNAFAYGRGDYIGGDGRAHIATTDCIANASGVATVTFKPPLSAAVASGAAIYSYVSSPFQLVSEDAGQNETEVGGLSEYALDFVEYLL